MSDYSGDGTGDNTEFLKRVITQLFNEINCCIPARIEAFDPATQQIECIPMIRRRVKNSDGSTEIIDYEKLIKVPLLTPYVRILGFSITMPINPGDLCLLLFADKPIDLWQETGDISDPPELTGTRNHHLTDGIAMLAPIPLPNAIVDYQIDSVEVRNLDRTTALQVWDDEVEVRAKPTNYTKWDKAGDIHSDAPGDITETADVDIKHTAGGVIVDTAGTTVTIEAQGGLVTIKSNTEIKLDAPLTTVTGALEVDGQATFNNGAIIGGVEHAGHTHTETGTETGGPNEA